MLRLKWTFILGGLSPHREYPAHRGCCIYWLWKSSQVCAVCGRPPFAHPLGFNTNDAMDRNLIGRGVLSAPPFIGPFYMSIGAQFIVQSWYTDSHRIEVLPPPLSEVFSFETLAKMVHTFVHQCIHADILV